MNLLCAACIRDGLDSVTWTANDAAPAVTVYGGRALCSRHLNVTLEAERPQPGEMPTGRMEP